MRKKILFVATIHKHFKSFHIPYIKWLKEQGYEVHVAANGGDTIIIEADKQYNICVQRSPFRIGNIKAYKELKAIIEKEQYDLVHCHTAMGAVVARLAAKTMRKQDLTKVLYTAHGFHFFKGAPSKYWYIYYPVEKWLSKYTDAIVTINQEDYDLILEKKFENKKVYLINGIGVNPFRFTLRTQDEKIQLRMRLGYNDNDFILLYVAEYIHRKNHKFIIEATQSLKDKIPSLKILFAGRGVLLDKMKDYANNLAIADSIDFLGFRNDIPDIISISDVGISASKQEGLGLNLIEEMFGGLPVVPTVDRGHKEIVQHTQNGYLFAQGDKDAFVSYVVDLYNNPDKRKAMGERAYQSVQKFSLNNSLKCMADIYNSLLNNNMMPTKYTRRGNIYNVQQIEKNHV